MNLINLMFNMAHINISETAICIFCALVVIILFILKFILIKRKMCLDVILTVILAVTSLFVVNKDTPLVWKIIITVCFVLILLYSIFDFVCSTKFYMVRKTKLQDYLKNSEFEYFLQTNAKNKIIDFSSNILSLTNRSKEGIYNLKFPEFLFDCLNIDTVNNEKYTLDTLPDFRRQYYETASKLKNYTFCFTAKDETNKVIDYEGIIQPIYLGNKLIGKNIYISVNRMQILDATREALTKAVNDLDDVRNQTYTLMSLTSGVVMYFDFLNKTYVATESFRKYTDTTKEEYDFDEFLRMLHPEDVQYYIDSSSTINSNNTVRIKYRLKIGNKYYSMVEDSIYLAKDDKLVSVVRVINDRQQVDAPDVVLSTQEVSDMIDDLASSNIGSLANNTLEKLNKLNNKNE